MFQSILTLLLNYIIQRLYKFKPIQIATSYAQDIYETTFLVVEFIGKEKRRWAGHVTRQDDSRWSLEHCSTV